METTHARSEEEKYKCVQNMDGSKDLEDSYTNIEATNDECKAY